MPGIEGTSRAEGAAVVQRGEEGGWANLSGVSELARALELEDEEIDALQAQLDELGIDLTDDCGRDGVEPLRVQPEDVATATTDALQLFLNEIRRYPLLTAEEEVELA